MERSAPPIYPTNPSKSNFKPETHLGTHDIALSIPSADHQTHRALPLLLLSPDDLTAPQALSQTLTRIQHLHSTSPTTAIIIFLLDQPTNNQPQQTAMQSFMDLHLTYFPSPFPPPLTPAN